MGLMQIHHNIYEVFMTKKENKKYILQKSQFSVINLFYICLIIAFFYGAGIVTAKLVKMIF